MHDNIPHIKGVIATRIKHKCTGKLEVFIAAGGGRWRCSRLSPVYPRAPLASGQDAQRRVSIIVTRYGPGRRDCILVLG